MDSLINTVMQKQNVTCYHATYVQPTEQRIIIERSLSGVPLKPKHPTRWRLPSTSRHQCSRGPSVFSSHCPYDVRNRSRTMPLYTTHTSTVQKVFQNKVKLLLKENE